MGSLNPFKKPKVYTPEPLPSMPAEVTLSAADQAAQQEKDRLKRLSQQGRASTILTQNTSDTSTSGLATKALLGGNK